MRPELDSFSLQNTQNLLKSVQDCYDNGNNGVAQIAKIIGKRTRPRPTEKIHVLLLGDSSSGKSSFVNYYCSKPYDSANPKDMDHILETGVRSTTQTLTFIESAPCRETLNAASSLQHCPGLHTMVNAVDDPRLERYISTELVVSTERSFPNIVFADTPGLLLSNAEQPFDVHRTLKYLAEEWSDLILCFLSFDTNSHTIDLISNLCRSSAGQRKTHFLLNRTDQVHDDFDHISLVVQTTQNLASVLDHRFNVYTTFVPQLATNHRTHNAISVVERVIDRTVREHSQRCLSQLEADIDRLTDAADAELGVHAVGERRRAAWARVRGVVLLVGVLVVALGVFLAAVHLKTLPIGALPGWAAGGVGRVLGLSRSIQIYTAAGVTGLLGLAVGVSCLAAPAVASKVRLSRLDWAVESLSEHQATTESLRRGLVSDGLGVAVDQGQ